MRGLFGRKVARHDRRMSHTDELTCKFYGCNFDSRAQLHSASLTPTHAQFGKLPDGSGSDARRSRKVYCTNTARAQPTDIHQRSDSQPGLPPTDELNCDFRQLLFAVWVNLLASACMVFSNIASALKSITISRTFLTFSRSCAIHFERTNSGCHHKNMRHTLTHI